MSRSPMVVRTVPALRRAVEAMRIRKAAVALVPTMGALHDGHVSLVRLAKRRAQKVVVSIFVNPTQFAPTEDFGSYPRTWKADVAKLAAEKVDLIWNPDVKAMYPDGFATRIVPEGPATAGLEDRDQPLVGVPLNGAFSGDPFGTAVPAGAVRTVRDIKDHRIDRRTDAADCRPVRILGLRAIGRDEADQCSENGSA